MKWKDVVGYEGLYQVSDTGLVRSLDRTVLSRQGNPWVKKGRTLRLNMTQRHGYVTVCLTTRDQLEVTHMTHVLVAEAFLGKKPNNQEVRHRDSIRTNNRVDNLRYGTRSDNRMDTKALGYGTSAYLGIGLHKKTGKWRARVSGVHLGLFETELAAADARDKYIIDNNIKDRALNNV